MYRFGVFGLAIQRPHATHFTTSRCINLEERVNSNIQKKELQSYNPASNGLLFIFCWIPPEIDSIQPQLNATARHRTATCAKCCASCWIREVLSGRQRTRICNIAIEVSLFSTNLFSDMSDTAGDHRQMCTPTSRTGANHKELWGSVLVLVRYGTVPHYWEERKRKDKGGKREREREREKKERKGK